MRALFLVLYFSNHRTPFAAISPPDGDQDVERAIVVSCPVGLIRCPCC